MKFVPENLRTSTVRFSRICAELRIPEAFESRVPA